MRHLSTDESAGTSTRRWSPRDRADALAAVESGRYYCTDLEKAPVSPWMWPTASQEAERARVAALDPVKMAVGWLLLLHGRQRWYEDQHATFARLLRAGETYGWLARDQREEMAVRFDGYGAEARAKADRWLRLAVRVRDEGLPAR